MLNHLTPDICLHTLAMLHSMQQQHRLLIHTTCCPCKPASQLSVYQQTQASQLSWTGNFWKRYDMAFPVIFFGRGFIQGFLCFRLWKWTLQPSRYQYIYISIVARMPFISMLNAYIFCRRNLSVQLCVLKNEANQI